MPAESGEFGIDCGQILGKLKNLVRRDCSHPTTLSGTENGRCVNIASWGIIPPAVALFHHRHFSIDTEQTASTASACLELLVMTTELSRFGYTRLIFPQYANRLLAS
jgi:hypothetical protein